MKEKKPLWKKWWFWLIVVIFVGVIGTSATNNDEPKKKENTTQQQEKSNETDTKETDSKEDDSKTEEFYIGDEIVMGDYILTVDKTKKSAGTEFDKPKKGNEFLIISVTIKNNGEDEINYNPYDFTVQNGNGQVNDITFTMVDSDTALSSGKLIAGGSVSGTLAFEVPKDDKKLLLRYQPDFWSDKEIQIHLKKNK